jgi:phosphoserine phosphatase
LRLNETLANDLEIQDGHLTGRVTGPIVDGERKAETLATTAARLGLNSHQVLAVGDGANDLPMMRRAGVSIAYHAKPVVRKEATHALNWVGLDGIPHLFS